MNIGTPIRRFTAVPLDEPVLPTHEPVRQLPAPAERPLALPAPAEPQRVE